MHPLGRAGEAAVAVEAGPHQRVVRDVVAAEQGRDPLEEGGLGHRSGGGQQAEHRPLDAVGERHGGGGDVVRVGQPPAAGLDLGEAALGRAGELVADQAEQAIDRIGPVRRRDRRRDGAGRSGPTRLAPGSAGRLAAARSRRSPGRRRARRRRRSRRGPVAAASGHVASSAAAVGGRRSSGAGRRPGRARPGSRRAAARSGPVRRAPGGSRRRPRSRSARRRRPRTAGRRRARAARTGPRPGTTSGSPAPPGSGSSPTFPRVRAPGGRRPRGCSSSTTGAAGSSASATLRAEQPIAGGRRPEDDRERRFRRRRRPAGRSRPSRAMRRLERAQAPRRTRRACQLHGGRSDAPASASIGSSSAASRPSAQAVAW